MGPRLFRMFVFTLPTLFAAFVTSAWTPTPPPPAETTAIACDVTSELELGGTGTFTCTGLTANGQVIVIFTPPDGPSTNHVGSTDGNGVITGTFTVATDRPTGRWTVHIVDQETGNVISSPFTVAAVVTVPPTDTPPVPTLTELVVVDAPTTAVTPTSNPNLVWYVIGAVGVLAAAAVAIGKARIWGKASQPAHMVAQTGTKLRSSLKTLGSRWSIRKSPTPVLNLVILPLVRYPETQNTAKARTESGRRLRRETCCQRDQSFAREKVLKSH